MPHFKTVLGDITEKEVGITLPHEHICCYSEYLYEMAGKKYINKEKLLEVSVKHLEKLKRKYGLNTFIDCTPVNIGRDVELLKSVSKQTGINIICATGFYYTEESLLYNLDTDYIVNYIVLDAKSTNAGIIKCAVEEDRTSELNKKILIASAIAQKALQIPIVLHTNANNKNGLKALEILLSQGVKPQAITVGHLSDTEDLNYIKHIADYGCFIGFDRLYNDYSQEYIERRVEEILELCKNGYENKILLSHDALFFNGFDAKPRINEKPRFSYCFDYILPRLPNNLVWKIVGENPVKMLKCGE